MLLCGLHDFHTHSQSDVLATSVNQNLPKMASVIGILSHLAVQHRDCLEKAMWSLVEARTVSSSPGSGDLSSQDRKVVY